MYRPYTLSVLIACKKLKELANETEFETTRDVWNELYILERDKLIELSKDSALDTIITNLEQKMPIFEEYVAKHTDNEEKEVFKRIKKDFRSLDDMWVYLIMTDMDIRQMYIESFYGIKGGEHLAEVIRKSVVKFVIGCNIQKKK